MISPEENNKLLFILNIKKVKDKRIHRINNSLGVYDAYKYIRKNKWLDINLILTEHLFYTIIRLINNYLADELTKGKDIILPNRMGKLEIRKYDSRIDIKDGKVITNLPIDWNLTLKLWYENEEAYKNKTLIKMEEKEIFKIYYNRIKANFNNKSFYQFNINRLLKLKLKLNIKRGIIDAFKFK